MAFQTQNARHPVVGEKKKQNTEILYGNRERQKGVKGQLALLCKSSPALNWENTVAGLTVG